MAGYVVQILSNAETRRYYLDALNEDAACQATIKALGIEPAAVSVLRTMAKWEEEVFPPFPDELRPAP